MKITKTKVIVVITGLLIGMNLVAYFHAWKFTHFDDTGITRTDDPVRLSTIGKLKTLFLGIDNPRPSNTIKPYSGFQNISVPFDNDTLACWIVPVDSSKGTVILFHGYAGNRSQVVEESNYFHELGYTTVLVDFLGSGKSTGSGTTIGYYESDQVKRIYDYFSLRVPGPVTLFGTSMGSVAIMKSIHDHQIAPSSIILECPFGNMEETVKARFRLMKAPAFPMAYLLLFWGGVQNDFNAFGHNPGEYAKSINIKTLLLYGMQDVKVSKAETDSIFQNIQGDKQLKIFSSCGHENLMLDCEDEWKDSVIDYLNSQN